MAAPAAAGAHGLVSRADLPIPAWLFAWAAALVLAISFFAFAVMWREPALEHARATRLLRIPRVVPVVTGAVGIALFAFVVYAGFKGSQVPTDNLIDTFTFVGFWAALPILVAIFGDFFAPCNPWRAVGRFCGWSVRTVARRDPPPPFAYPDRLGTWPAVVFLLGFGWIELVWSRGNVPDNLALAATVYAFIQLAGMSLFGAETWLARGDGIGLYFSTIGRMSALAVREGHLIRRKVLSGLSDIDFPSGMVAFICAGIAITTFDGLSEGGPWTDLGGNIHSVFVSLGTGVTWSTELTNTIGLLLCFGFVTGFYRLGVYGMSGRSTGRSTRELSRIFAGALVPIIVGYVAAHYCSFIIFQGQALWSLASDPLGSGANWFGTAGAGIDLGLVSLKGIWYIQVAALVIGHVLGLAVAHDKALAVFGKTKAAVSSQYWMLVVMVGFTSVGLWLLSMSNR